MCGRVERCGGNVVDSSALQFCVSVPSGKVPLAFFPGTGTFNQTILVPIRVSMCYCCCRPLSVVANALPAVAAALPVAADTGQQTPPHHYHNTSTKSVSQERRRGRRQRGKD
ncbi:hypothetical protein VNO80_06842 [Phaseolus coccineus]|uniref:Uncharacterized protein n=1 Tax=Phaseolus coccineus TaxID=3886 RepID=A0AAN9NJ15_PHACN